MNTAIFDISATVRQAREGDTAAFARIVRHYQAMVSGVIFSVTGDFHQSEDLAQETFLVAWRKLDELQNAESLPGWLSTIARNLARHSFRKKRETPGEISTETQSPQPRPDEELLRREQSELVWSAISEIPESQRETLVLFYRGGRSVREIAAATDSSEEAVKQRLVRARRSLKSKIETVIGDVLAETSPGDVFTLGVMTLVTGATMTVSAQAAATVVAATGSLGAGQAGAGISGGISAGKGVGGASLSAVIFPFVWALIMPLFYASFLWSIIRNAPTLRCRRLTVAVILRSYQCAVLGFFAMLLLISLGDEFDVLPDGVWSVVAFSMAPVLVWGVWISGKFRLARRIVREDVGLKPVADPKAWSFEDLERRMQRTLLGNFIVAESFIALMIFGSLYDGSFGPTTFLILLAVTFGLAIFQYAFYRIGRHVLFVSRDADGFFSAPPYHEKSLEKMVSRNPVHWNGKSMSGGRFVNILGVIFCSMLFAWFISFYDWQTRPVGHAVIFAIMALWCATFIFSVKRLNARGVAPHDWRRFCIAVAFGGAYVVFGLALELVEGREISLAAAKSAFASGGNRNPAFFDWGFVVGGLLLTLLMSFSILGVRFRNAKNRNAFEDPDDMAEKLAAFRAAFQPTKHESAKPAPYRGRALPRRGTAIGLGYGAILLTALIAGIYTQYNVIMSNHYAKRGRYDLAIRYNPGNAELYYRRAWESGSPQSKIDDCTEAIRLKPDYADAYARRGDVLCDLKQYDRAVADYTEAIRLEPNESGHYSDRGSVWAKAGQYDKAVADCTEAIRIAENPVDRKSEWFSDWYRSWAYEQRALVYKMSGDLDAAAADYREILRVKPGEHHYLTLARLLEEKGDLQAAVDCCNDGIRFSDTEEHGGILRDDLQKLRDKIREEIRENER